MYHSHWSDRLPHLVPIWHSLSNQNLQNFSENSIDLNLALDFGGTGFYNQTALRHYQPLQFSTNRPTLPFYIKPRSQENVCQATRNCLTFSNKHKVLFSANQAKISGISVSIDSNRFQHNSNDVNYNFAHQFSDKNTSRKNPFCFHAENIWGFTEPPKNNTSSEHILEIRLEEHDNQEIKLWSQTRTSLKEYKCHPQNDEDNDLKSFNFELVNDISAVSKALFPTENSFLNFWDRNDFVTEDFLATFVESNIIYRWNVEANKYMVANTVDPSSHLANTNNFIGLQWAKELNPFLYFYGTHNDIFLGDTRTNLDGSQRMSQTIMNAQKFPHFKDPIELFQTFTDNPANNHQIITSSDFSINFFDIRYSGKNIFQCKHMMTSRLVNKLYSKPLTGCNGCEMILLASNSERCCLFPFNPQTSIQPIMQSYPYYIGMPKETGSLFPALKSDKSFITGTQILLGKHSAEGDAEDFISIAQLTNNGDIYMQDFWPLGQEPSRLLRITSSDENQNANVQKDLHEDLDTASTFYLKSVIKFLKNKPTNNHTQKKRYEFKH